MVAFAGVRGDGVPTEALLDGSASGSGDGFAAIRALQKLTYSPREFGGCGANQYVTAILQREARAAYWGRDNRPAARHRFHDFDVGPRGDVERHRHNRSLRI